MSARGHGSRVIPWLFLLPFGLLFVCFTVLPLAQSVPLAMSHTFGPDTTTPVGLEKFRQALADPRFWHATRNTAVYAAAAVVFQLPLALVLAMVLNRPDLRGRSVFRLLFFSPQLLGLVFVAVLASVAFQKQNGLVNVLWARVCGWIREIPGAGFLPTPAEALATPWLETLAMPTLILTAMWMYTGFNMVYFLAALQNVSKDLREAAVLDGADRVQQFWHVTLPAIRPVAVFIVLLAIIGSFQLFELPYIMLPEGVGLQDRGLTIVTYLFKNGFEAGDLGYAAAIGWLLALMLGAIAIGQRLLVREEIAT